MCLIFNLFCATVINAQTITPIRVDAWITGYSAEVNQTDNTPLYTANGEHVHFGGVACPRKYKFGTMVQVGGLEFICNDRLAKKYDDRFDIYFDASKEAKEWGKIKQTVYVYSQ